MTPAELASLRALARLHPLEPSVITYAGHVHLVDADGRTLLGEGDVPLRYATADGCATALLAGIKREAERAARAAVEADALATDRERRLAQAREVIAAEGAWF